MPMAFSYLIKTFLYDCLSSYIALFWLEDAPLVSHMWILLQNSGAALEKKLIQRIDENSDLKRGLHVSHQPPPAPHTLLMLFCPSILMGEETYNDSIFHVSVRNSAMRVMSQQYIS